MKLKNPIKEFEREAQGNIERLGKNKKLKTQAIEFATAAALNHYLYNFSWLGRPIIQYPQDIVAAQELIWRVKPDLIIETGIAHGGSLIFSASILELIGGDGKVLGIDIDIRKHNLEAIKKHRLYKRIKMLEGSSIAPAIIKKVKMFMKGRQKILVFLDSNHTHEHVLQELELYSGLVSRGSYIVVFDTLIEFAPRASYKNRQWNKGNNPMTAVKAFLKKHSNFVVDKEIENKFLITSAPHGFLKRIR